MKKLVLLLVIVISLLLVSCGTEPAVDPRHEPIPGNAAPPKYVPPVKENVTVEESNSSEDVDLDVIVDEPNSSEEEPDVIVEEKTLMNDPNTFVVDVIVDQSSFNPYLTEIQEVIKVTDFKLNQLTGVNLELRKVYYLDTLGESTNSYKDSLQYKKILNDKAVNGVIVLTKEFNTEEQGGFSVSYEFPDYCNGFKSPKVGQNIIYYAYMDWEHKYASCGYNYDTDEHISNVSIGGECRGIQGTPCVFNGNYYICENAQEYFYSEFNNFMGSLFIHEMMHPFGEHGNYDHYGASSCLQEEFDLATSQYYCGMCPNVYENFKNSFIECS